MANKDYASLTSQPSGSMTKLRAEQMRSEDGFSSLALDLEALRGQVKDIIGAADYKEEITGDYAKVQLVDLKQHLDAQGGSELVVKLASAMSGAVQMYSTLNVDGEATLASAIVEDLTASRLMASDAGKGLVSADLYAWVAGTGNQVAVADDADGSITLSLPQDIDTAANVEFAGVKVSGLTAGRVVFAGMSGSLVDDSDFTFSADVLTVNGSTFGQDVSIAGNLTVMGTTTQIDTTNLLVADAKIVISSGSAVEGAGIYLADDSAGENIRWTLADDGKWIASDKFMADTLQAGDLSSAIVWADASGNLVGISDADFGGAMFARLVEGTGVEITEAAGNITIAIGQPVGTSDQVQFAAVTGSIVANGLTTGQLVKNTGGLLVDADINDFISAGTGVSIDSNGEISIGQAVGTTDAVTFGKVSLDGADAYVDGGAGYLELGFLGGSIPVAQSGSVALSGFSASSIIGALNELKSVASASSKKATAEMITNQAAGADVKSLLSSDFIGELDAANGMVFVNGQLMLSGALGSKDYTVDGGVLKFTFDLQAGDVLVVQKA